MTSRYPKGQTRDPNTVRARLENSWRFYLATIANYIAVRQYGRLS